jgi:hypothetical protein
VYLSTMPSYPQPMRTQRQFALGAYQAAARAQRVRRVRRAQHTLGLTASPTEQGIVKGVTAGVAMIPVVGPFLAPLIGQIANLFTGAHAAAMQKEGQTLNQSTPGFLGGIQAIFQQLNAGQMSPAQAIAALQGIQAAYYSSVSNIIKKGGTCTVAANGLDTGSIDSRGCPVTSDPCNAACCLGCSIIEPAIRNLTAIVNAGGGNYTVPATPTNGAIAGTPSFNVSYAPGALGSAGAALSGMPSWVWLAGGGALLWFLLRR